MILNYRTIQHIKKKNPVDKSICYFWCIDLIIILLTNNIITDKLKKDKTTIHFFMWYNYSSRQTYSKYRLGFYTLPIYK